MGMHSHLKFSQLTHNAPFRGANERKHLLDTVAVLGLFYSLQRDLKRKPFSIECTVGAFQ